MHRLLPVLVISVSFLAVPFELGAQTGITTRVSVTTGGVQANAQSWEASISANGRYVAFSSDATNLVAGDTNAARDVFVYDRQTGTTTRVSEAAGGVQANGESSNPSISGDGRYVAFESAATNLEGGVDTNGLRDVFVHDRQTGTTLRMSADNGGGQVTGPTGSFWPRISRDGRYVAFHSGATNLVANDTNGLQDVFVKDRWTGQNARVSVASGGSQSSGGASANPCISEDGRYVAFESNATNLVAGDTNGRYDIFVHDRQSGATSRVSVTTTGMQSDGHSNRCAISGDGRRVAFESSATNLVAGDGNGKSDVFVRNREALTTTRVSVASDGSEAAVSANGSQMAAISGEGHHVAFWSEATNLVANDTNGVTDAFVHDLETGATVRASVATSGAQANGGSVGVYGLSHDGRHLVFTCHATNFVASDTNSARDVFVRTRASVPHDYDGDGKADIGVFRPSTGGWYAVLSSTGEAVGVLWGTTGDVPVPADYDGDGLSDAAVFRPTDGTWYVMFNAGGSAGIPWGASGDTPAPGDYDGDGKADVAVFRPSANAWYIVRSSTGTATGVIWGDASDLPVPADYDGDGKTDVAVFRGSTHAWYVVKSSTGTAVGFIWGDVGDIPVVADYDGDGKADVGVFRGSNHAWYIIRSTTGTAVGFLWGDTGDVPVFGDYDGDGKADVVVFRPSTGAWYIMKSTGGAVGLFWGTAGDLPV